jgi:hypothetical protein
MNNNSTNITIGSQFLGLLTIAFIVLKLCHVINWSWLWVLSPLILPIIIVIIIFVVIVIIRIIMIRN